MMQWLPQNDIIMINVVNVPVCCIPITINFTTKSLQDLFVFGCVRMKIIWEIVVNIFLSKTLKAKEKKNSSIRFYPETKWNSVKPSIFLIKPNPEHRNPSWSFNWVFLSPPFFEALSSVSMYLDCEKPISTWKRKQKNFIHLKKKFST